MLTIIVWSLCIAYGIGTLVVAIRAYRKTKAEQHVLRRLRNL